MTVKSNHHTVSDKSQAEPSHQDSTPQHQEEYYNKNAFAMDKSHPKPIEDNDKHETIKARQKNNLLSIQHSGKKGAVNWC